MVYRLQASQVFVTVSKLTRRTIRAKKKKLGERVKFAMYTEVYLYDHYKAST